MSRYFIEVFYKGTNYSGFQIQQNSNSIQAEVEKALKIFFKEDFLLTGSSRTDAGVHARSNYFHFDSGNLRLTDPENIMRGVYNLNAILPADIVIKQIFEVAPGAHCRFDAITRQYKYYIYSNKNPFLSDIAYYYPYKLEIDLLKEVAAKVLLFKDFSSFSKRNTQVKSFICNVITSSWLREADTLVYTVEANRFLRGMVRGLVGTMLKVGTGRLSPQDFINIIESKNSSLADFSAPPQGLFLNKVNY